jgi:hypothetical protein
MWHGMNKTDSVMSQKTVAPSSSSQLVAITFLKLTTVLNFSVAGDVGCFCILDSIFVLWIVVMYPRVTISDMSQKVISFSYVTLLIA